MTELPRIKVALVTGGAKRLGRTIALALARHGWDIAIHYHRSQDAARQTAAEIQALGRRALCIQADLADETQTKNLLPQAQSLGPVTCLINNASRFEFDSVVDFNYANLQAHLLSNVAAPVLLASEFHARLADDATGVIVNLLDQKLHNLNPDFLSYTLSKAALETATLLLAKALAPKVRVTAVAPGLTLPSYLQDAAHFERAHRMTVLGRSSEPDDIAEAVLFLVSQRAITGTVLLVDGGQHLSPAARDASFSNK